MGEIASYPLIPLVFHVTMACLECGIDLGSLQQKLCYDCGNKLDKCYVCGYQDTVSDTVRCERCLVEANGRCECGSPKGGSGNCLADGGQ